MPNAPQMFVNIICLGVAKTGKSCAIRRFRDDKDVSFNEYSSSIAADFTTVQGLVNSQPMKLQFWDIAGDSRFRTSQHLIPLICGRLDIIMLFFDITEPEALNNLEKYLTALDEKNIERERIILVGAKSDLADTRQVSVEATRTWATTHGISTYIEVSAKDDPENLKEQFLQAIGGRLTTITPTPDPTPAAHSQPPIIDVIAQPAPPSRSLFRGLFCGLFSSVPAHNRYLLTDGANADPQFSEDFRAIFTHLYNAKTFTNRTTAAKAVLDSDAVLSQENLVQHASAAPISRTNRTKQTMDILQQLRGIQDENPDLKASNMRRFLEEFSATYYYAHLNTDGIFFATSSYPKNSWVWKSDLSRVPPEDLKTYLIDVLCRAVEKPNSRTAAAVTRVMQELISTRSPTIG